ncbi:MAG: bestrophin family ion channel [Bdellovibrionota bacterium]
MMFSFLSLFVRTSSDKHSNCKSEGIPELTNQGENKSFFRTALAWRGSATPQILPRVAAAMIYGAAVTYAVSLVPHYEMPITPFEYFGAVIGLLLVLRANAGVDRWWEARKIWGSIVNQSRNLAIAGYEYSKNKGATTREFVRWVAVWPYVMKASLRRSTTCPEATRLLGETEGRLIEKAQHMPTYVGSRIARLLVQMRAEGLDDFAFHRAERERSIMIDNIGACERIRNTPIPYVLAIKVRRFIFIFLLLLPFALVERLDWLTPIVTALVSYPLFSLDEIGAELQNPFSPRNLSHLPLSSICETIEGNVLALMEESEKDRLTG